MNQDLLRNHSRTL